MTWMKWWMPAIWILGTACGGQGSGAADADSDVDGDTDVDADADGDGDTDGDADADSDGDGDTDGDTDADGDSDSGPEDTDTTPAVCEAALVDGRLVHGDAPPLVKVDPGCGRLSYGRYANQGQDNAVNILPDFSFAGYMGGGVAIPDVPVVATLGPEPGDNLARIQAAIDEVSGRTPDENGFRGALLLTAGTWDVSDTLRVSAGGVVIRGEGQGVDGTVLVATKAAQHDLIVFAGSGSGMGEVEDSRVSITTPYVPVGSRTFEVSSAAGFAPGDTIAVLRTPNQAWLDDLTMTQWGWTTSAYTVAHERTVVAVDGNAITVDIPVVDTMEEKWGGGAVFAANLSGRISQCGIEDIRLVSSYAGDEDEAHGWNAITLRRVRDSWVRRVTSVHFGYSAVNIEGESSFNTIEEVAQLDPISIITGGRRYSFNVGDGIGNLFQRCYARNGRHNFVTGAQVTGPNVWLDSHSTQKHADEGPHHRWATGLLFDSLSSAQFHVQNREDSGTGHGWAGAQTLFWNLTATSQIICDAPLGAMNWAVGTIGTHAEGSWAPEEPDGWWESEGTPVLPRSLYLAQLEDRLGEEAVEAVTTANQRDGSIPGQLAGWAGEGLLADAEPVGEVTCEGILAGSACCPLSCGTCGGTGCGGLPGGAENCCTGSILAANLSCETHPPPCVVP